MAARLTVIIPTRERPETLKYSLQTVTAQENPDIEILVSDNFSGPAIKAVVDAAGDPRVRYVRTSGRLGMSEHWDFAISHATGDWVTILGDDDGLLPGAADRLFAIIRQNPGIKAITSAVCRFHWPSEGNNDGKLSLVKGRGYEIRDGLDVTRRTMYGEIIAMPTIYTGGFVHKDILQAVRQKNPDGKFFQSMLPDIYSGLAICAVVGKYIYSWEALAIAGSATNSNSRQYKGKPKVEMEKLAFHKESGIPFHPSLEGSSVESMQIVLYESFLQTEVLRSDNFGVTLAQQLEIALSNASQRVWDAVYEYCRVVSEKNHLDFEAIVVAANAKKGRQRMQRQWRKFKNKVLRAGKLSKQTINDDRVRTIYDAAQKVGPMVA